MQKLLEEKDKKEEEQTNSEEGQKILKRNCWERKQSDKAQQSRNAAKVMEAKLEQGINIQI